MSCAARRPPPLACRRTSVCRSAFRERRRGKGSEGDTVVAILVPFRQQREQDRLAQLRAFEQHMAGFLSGRDGVQFVVVVAEQSSDGRAFNRGALLNAAYREAQQRCAPHQALASAIFHDVDLLPSDGLLRYYREPPSSGRPSHIAGPTTWDKYAGLLGGYRDIFLGGVTALSPPDFERAVRRPACGRARSPRAGPPRVLSPA